MPSSVGWSRPVGRSPRPTSAVTERRLRACGYSLQKAGYLRAIATAVDDGFDLEALGRRGDNEARPRLVALRGIGPWTADNYLLFALRRADVFPGGDRAL